MSTKTRIYPLAALAACLATGCQSDATPPVCAPVYTTTGNSGLVDGPSTSGDSTPTYQQPVLHFPVDDAGDSDPDAGLPEVRATFSTGGNGHRLLEIDLEGGSLRDVSELQLAWSTSQVRSYQMVSSSQSREDGKLHLQLILDVVELPQDPSNPVPTLAGTLSFWQQDGDAWTRQGSDIELVDPAPPVFAPIDSPMLPGNSIATDCG